MLCEIEIIDASSLIQYASKRLYEYLERHNNAVVWKKAQFSQGFSALKFYFQLLWCISMQFHAFFI